MTNLEIWLLAVSLAMDCNTSAQKILGYLLLTIALFLGFHHVFYHLVIAHLLCRCYLYTEKKQNEYREFSHIVYFHR